MFSVGQEVVCVDPGKPLNPWHQAHPLIKGQHYIIRYVGLHYYDAKKVRIDSSLRLWDETSFRPLKFDPIPTYAEVPLFVQSSIPSGWTKGLTTYVGTFKEDPENGTS